jgi:hypothetical protein
MPDLDLIKQGEQGCGTGAGVPERVYDLTTIVGSSTETPYCHVEDGRLGCDGLPVGAGERMIGSTRSDPGDKSSAARAAALLRRRATHGMIIRARADRLSVLLPGRCLATFAAQLLDVC